MGDRQIYFSLVAGIALISIGTWAFTVSNVSPHLSLVGLGLFVAGSTIKLNNLIKASAKQTSNLPIPEIFATKEIGSDTPRGLKDAA